MSEKTIQNNILKQLRELGWFVKPTYTNLSGCPDIMGCIDGRFVAIEVKQKNGLPTKKQKHELTRIRQAGGVSFHVSSWEDCEERLRMKGVIQ